MQQRRLNRRTKKIDQIRGPDDLREILEKEAQEAAGLQQKLLELTEGIMEKENGG